MTDFHDINFPEFLAIYAKPVINFSNIVTSTASQREIRTLEHPYSMRKYFVENSKISKEQFEIFQAFFFTRFGRKYSFRLKDYSDYFIEEQEVESKLQDLRYIQIYKKYKSGNYDFHRKISLLRPEKLKLEKNGKAIDLKEIDLTRGIIHLTHLECAEKIVIKYAEFDTKVRFFSDSLSYSLCSNDAFSLCNLELIEIL